MRMNVLIEVLGMLLNGLMLLLVVQAVLSWLVAFNVVNMHNDFVRNVVFRLDSLFTPMLRPIRRFMPDLGGIDLSPMVLMLIFMMALKALSLFTLGF